jgi:hypothetical protein
MDACQPSIGSEIAVILWARRLNHPSHSEQDA